MDMSRYRSRSRSCSPPHPKRYDDPRDGYRGNFRDHRSPAPSGLLVRNISLDARPEDLRVPFERFGPVKDVYLPKNYYTGEPRGFGFVKFRDPEDAYEAKLQMNHQVIRGREITIVFAEENRKTPQEMRLNARVSGRYMGGRDRRRSPVRPTKCRYPTYSRSPTPMRYDTRDPGRVIHDDYYSSQSVSPSSRSRPERRYREENGCSSYGRSMSRSPSYSPR